MGLTIEVERGSPKSGQNPASRICFETAEAKRAWRFFRMLPPAPGALRLFFGSSRQVANLPHPSIVPAIVDPPTTAANRFFERRSSRTIRTSGSPNTPRTVAFARKPTNEYPSDRRRCRFAERAISQHGKIEPASKPRKSLSTSLSAAMIPQNHPLDSLKTQPI